MSVNSEMSLTLAPCHSLCSREYKLHVPLNSTGTPLLHRVTPHCAKASSKCLINPDWQQPWSHVTGANAATDASPCSLCRLLGPLLLWHHRFSLMTCKPHRASVSSRRRRLACGIGCIMIQGQSHCLADGDDRATRPIAAHA